MKRYLGFSLIGYVLVLVILSSAYVLMSKSYSSYQTKKRAIDVAENIRTINQIVQDQSHSSLTWNLDPGGVAIDKSFPASLTWTSGTNGFIDGRGTAYVLDALGGSDITSFSGVTDPRQAYFIQFNLPADDYRTSICTQVAQALNSEFRGIRTNMGLIKDGADFSGTQSACVNTSTFLQFVTF